MRMYLISICLLVGLSFSSSSYAANGDGYVTFVVHRTGFIYVQSGYIVVGYIQNGSSTFYNQVSVPSGSHFNPASFDSSPGAPPLPPGDSIIGTFTIPLDETHVFATTRGRKIMVTAVEPVWD